MRRILLATIVLSLAFAAGLRATVGLGLQAQLGNPSQATADPGNRLNYLIERAQYSLDYSDTLREPNWVSWNLTSTDVGSAGRSSSFFVETALPPGFTPVLTTDYSGSGFDRGHMCPSADRTLSRADNDFTFYMSNMVPQAPDNNQGVWANFETYCRSLAAAGHEVLIVSGPGGFGGSSLATGVAIPGYVWKVVVVVPLGSGTAVSRIDASTRVIAIKIPNVQGVRSAPWQDYITSAAQLELDLGYSFFRELPAPVAAALRAKVDGQTAVGAPAITTPPVAQTAPVGGSASFSVVASGDAPLAYQWLKEDLEIPGATAATLVINPVTATDAASYSVVVSNAVGTATSPAATLTVTGLPVAIVTSPTPVTALAGTTAVFTVQVSGSPTISYQWRKSGSPLSNGGNVTGALGSTLTITNVQAGDIASYDVVATNGVNSVTSAAAALTVTPSAPVITSQPKAQSVAAGGTAVFSVSALGSTTLSYQWRKDGSDLANGGGVSGAATPTLTLSGVTAADVGNYDVVVSNTVGTATSNAVALNLVSAGAGQLAYTGGTITQNFDTLPGSGTFLLSGFGPFPLNAAPFNATGMPGWSFARIAGSGSNATFLVGTGSANTGAVYSFGLTGSSDRAFGALLSGTVASTWGLVLVNNTGTTISQFSVSYTGEQWRYGGTTSGPDRSYLEYSVGASDILTGSFTAATGVEFPSPVTSGASGAINGNLPANRAVVSGTVSGITWLPGQTLVLRWQDFNVLGSDDGHAIDDFSFSTSVGTAPVVASVSPADAATDVAVTSPVTVSFNQSVAVSGSWFSITSAANGPVAATVTGGPVSYTLTPPVSFANGDTVTVRILASQVKDGATNTVTMAADKVFSFTTAAGSGAVAPSITTQPLAQSALVGGTASFSVAATGTAPLTYEWRKGGVPITGNPSAATSTLTLTGITSADAGAFSCLVSNQAGSDLSAAATLTVNVPPTITTQPVAQSVTAGDTVSLSVVASGTAPLSYQWRKSGSPVLNGGTISGAATATLTFTGVTVADAGSYDVVVSNGFGTPATSAAVALNVAVPLSRLNFAGGTYQQNFNTLPSAGTFSFSGNGPFSLDASPGVNATGMTGWSFVKHAGSGLNALFRHDTGSSNAGATISYGSAGSSDRALGSLASGSVSSRLGLTLVNTSGRTITYVTVSYTGEQWRHGGATTPNKLAFSYSVGAANIAAGTFTSVPALDFVAPIITTSTSALDGNLSANRVPNITATLAGMNWAPGATLVLRWTDVDDSGSDDGLALDDFSISDAPPVPVITTQPISQTVAAFSPVSFTVAATSTTPLMYQWRKLGVPIVGNASAATATLVLSSATAGDAGAYDCVLSNDYGSTTSSVATLSVTPVPATVVLGNLSTTYDGTPRVVTATTTPAGISVGVTYDGSLTAPTNAGSYAVVATIDDPNYTGSATGTLVVQRAPALVTLSGLNVTYDGTPKDVIVGTAPSGLGYAVSYDGNAAAPVNAGSYAVVAAVTNPNYVGSGTGTLVIARAPATVVLSGLRQAYDGTPKSVSVATVPAGLGFSVTYGGGSAAPVGPGAFPVVATVNAPNYVGTASGTLVITTTALVRHAPVLNGDIDGSIQVLLPENITLNGSALVSGDLLVPGTPKLRLNGKPTFVGVRDGTGSATPGNHTVTLSGGAVLRYLVQRTDAIAMPGVPVPPVTTGTRAVVITSRAASIGDSATLNSLTVSGNAGSVALPPGTYGSVVVNGSNVLVLGTPGATQPGIYNLQSLVQNGSSRIEVVGPVVINLATAASISGSLGSAGNPQWLQLNVARGSVTLNGGARIFGQILAPAGEVVINGNALVRGSVTSDRLTLNGNGLLEEVTP